MNNPSVIPAFDFREMVTTLDNKIITTSLKVADYFGKRHKDVLRAIRNLKCSDDFTQRNFAPIDFIDKNGDVQPMYNITRDGCMMLVMSSPRQWGCFHYREHGWEKGRVFPTPVGVFPKSVSMKPAMVGLPHARGGVSQVL